MTAATTCSSTSAPSSARAWARSTKARSFRFESKVDRHARQDQRGKPSRHVKQADMRFPRICTGIYRLTTPLDDMSSKPAGQTGGFFRISSLALTGAPAPGSLGNRAWRKRFGQVPQM